jgi:hypothetical protein
MAKRFERASISPNDDGTYTVSITPVRKKDKNGNTMWQEDKTYSAPTYDEAMMKIRGFKNNAQPDPQEDMENWMNPDRGSDEEEEPKEEAAE